MNTRACAPCASCPCCSSTARARLQPDRLRLPADAAGSAVEPRFAVNRRQFVGGLGALAALSVTLPSLSAAEAQACCSVKERAPLSRKPLRVQPVLTYETPQRREGTSWRNWGGIQTEAGARQEQARIADELKKLSAKAEFPLDVQPVLLVKAVEQAAAIAQGDYDVMLMYAAGGGLNLLETLTRKDRWNLMFLRHLPGPAYLWYEIVHPRFLRKTVDDFGQPGMDVHDVITDRYDEMLWKLRALHGLNSTHGKRVVCIGGAAGWGEGGQQAPQIARDRWKLDLVDYPYAELEPRLKAAYQDSVLVAGCEQAARAYLGKAGVKLETARQFVTNAFVLREVFLDVMEANRTDALTVNHCMGTIMGMSKTTACLTLSLLNDDGYLLFCESDFVVIPSGILLHYISGKPVFLNDPTTPHDGIVTLAHCTAPRRMDGKRLERARILTHFESDYGAAPKVEMKLGQVTTNLVPDFDCRKWVGFAATIVGNPFLEICRSQVDVKVHGDCQKLLEEMKGFHWMLAYGDYRQECGYALRKLGVDLLDVSARAA
jgi:hypothetical protein